MISTSELTRLFEVKYEYKNFVYYVMMILEHYFQIILI